jgi:hypothetical protein
MLSNPPAGCELLEQRFVELSRYSVIDVLDNGLGVAEFSVPHSAFKSLSTALGNLAIKQHAQPFTVRDHMQSPALRRLDAGADQAAGRTNRAQYRGAGRGRHA